MSAIPMLKLLPHYECGGAIVVLNLDMHWVEMYVELYIVSGRAWVQT